MDIPNTLRHKSAELKEQIASVELRLRLVTGQLDREYQYLQDLKDEKRKVDEAIVVLSNN